MIRIRFHGRGGHGIKTASRILGTAAFLAGHQVQDSPIYGAERRGAPVAAYVRISDEPIQERGVIDTPDMTVVADETLLGEHLALSARQRRPTAHVGQVVSDDPAVPVVFVNCENAEACRERLTGPVRLYTFDVTQLTRDILGQPGALSAGIAAAATRLCGVAGANDLVQATREELAALGLRDEVIEKNVRIAREVFAALPAVPFAARPAEPPPARVVSLHYQGAPRGAPNILAAGNASQRRTGNWRVDRPLIDRKLCTRCRLCLVQCPEGAIALDADGYPVIDYDHCKGCMICRQVCPIEAIAIQKEVRAW
jgi:pyruvate ferredoxin oxidoreductase gamma subunit